MSAPPTLILKKKPNILENKNKLDIIRIFDNTELSALNNVSICISVADFTPTTVATTSAATVNNKLTKV